MSYNIYLNCRCCGNPLRCDEVFQEGGIQCVGGTDLCELNVTYNYSAIYRFRDLDGRAAHETVNELRAVLSDEQPDSDYWKPTPGNVSVAASRLLKFAEQHPNGIWRVW